MSDNLAERMAKLEEKVDGITDKVDDLQSTLKDFIKKAENGFVSQDQFWPVKTIVYAGAGIVLSSVLAAAIYLVIHYHS